MEAGLRTGGRLARGLVHLAEVLQGQVDRTLRATHTLFCSRHHGTLISLCARTVKHWWFHDGGMQARCRPKYSRARITPLATMIARGVRFLATAARSATQDMRSKTSTGIAGLAVHPNPLPELESTYTQTLKVLEHLPPSSVYRQSAAAVTELRLGIVREALEKPFSTVSASEQAIERVEAKIDCGLAEELVKQATDEFHLAAKMTEWKPCVHITDQMGAARGSCASWAVEGLLDAPRCWRGRGVDSIPIELLRCIHQHHDKALA